MKQETERVRDRGDTIKKKHQGPLNQYEQGSFELTEMEAASTGLHGSAPGPLSLEHAFHSVFYGIPESENKCVSAS